MLEVTRADLKRFGLNRSQPEQTSSNNVRSGPLQEFSTLNDLTRRRRLGPGRRLPDTDTPEPIQRVLAGTNVKTSCGTGTFPNCCLISGNKGCLFFCAFISSCWPKSVSQSRQSRIGRWFGQSRSQPTKCSHTVTHVLGITQGGGAAQRFMANKVDVEKSRIIKMIAQRNETHHR